MVPAPKMATLWIRFIEKPLTAEDAEIAENTAASVVSLWQFIYGPVIFTSVDCDDLGIAYAGRFVRDRRNFIKCHRKGVASSAQFFAVGDMVSARGGYSRG